MSRWLQFLPPSARVSALLLGLLAIAILVSEWRRQVTVGTLIAERERLLEVRQDLLRLERELLLARSDEAEIASAGRNSLLQRLQERHQRVREGLAAIRGRLAPPVTDGAAFGALEEAVGKYRQSVHAELMLLERIGQPEGGGLLADLRRLEERLLAIAPDRSLEPRLLRMQLRQREFVGTLRTSEALTLLTEVDSLRQELEGRRASGELVRTLEQYRSQVEHVMASSLELTLIQGESGVRFDRLPEMFRAIEEPLDQRLESTAARSAQLRRLAGWLAAAFLAVAFLLLLVRARFERSRAHVLSGRVRRLAAGLQAFADGAEDSSLDLPRGGDLGQLTTSFLAMTRQIRGQIATIEAERRRAEKATRAKSEFLALVSHELRTPLHGILGMAELLQPALNDAHQRHLLEVIRRSGSTLLQVVNDLLDVSQLEAGKLELEPRSFDLVEVLEDLAEVHAPAAHDKGLELVFSMPAAGGRWSGDPMRLGQVLTNLISNAIKFTERGFVEVAVLRLEPVGEDRAVLEMSVTDTGPGVPTHLRDHIFGAFAQGEATLRRQHGGSGLGLSIVRELLVLMGGSIRLDEEGAGEGTGARFLLTAELGVAAAGAPSAVKTPEPLAGQRLLLADAHGPSREATAAQLTALGAEVEAVAAVAEPPPAQDPPLTGVVLGHPAAGGGEDLVRLAAELSVTGLTVVHLLPASRWRVDEGLVGHQLLRPPRRSALVEALGAAPAAAAPEAEPSTGEIGQIAGHVLLVEDNSVNRVVFGLMLEQIGCRATMAENGREAVDRFLEERYDLVLMDCFMPEMDGFEATRHIRGLDDQRRATVPIIALTASAFDTNRQRCLNAGMNEILSKPTTLEALTECLGRWLGEQDAIAEGA